MCRPRGRAPPHSGSPPLGGTTVLVVVVIGIPMLGGRPPPLSVMMMPGRNGGRDKAVVGSRPGLNTRCSKVVA